MTVDLKLYNVVSPEARVLLLSAGGPANDALLRDALHRSLDWGKLSWLAEWERATGPVWRRIRAVAPDAVPADVALSWERLAMVADFHALYLQERFGETLRALVDAGIDVVLLKGAALAVSVYDGFTDRPMGDVDILVDPLSAQRAWEVAASLGWSWDRAMFPEGSYREHHHLPPLTDSRRVGAKLELHTALSVFGHPFALGFDAVRNAARPVVVSGRSVHILDADHQIVHLSVHLAWSHLLSFGVWRTFRDIGAVVDGDDLDWDGMAAAARRHGATSCCYWTLRLARDLCGVEVPESVLTAIEAPTPPAVRGVVERHLVGQLFATERTCPSEWLRRFLWKAAIRPGRLRLGEGRPWDIDEVTAPTAGQAAPISRRLTKHAENVAQWAHYLRMVAAPKLK